MAERLSLITMLTRAAEGVGRVDRDGLRGTTLVTTDQVEAMALTLAALRLPPIRPGEKPDPEEYFSALLARLTKQGDEDMSLSIHLGESEIAEAIIRGGLSLGDIINCMRSDLGDDAMLGEVVAADVSNTLDRGLHGAEMRAFLEGIETAAETMIKEGAAE